MIPIYKGKVKRFADELKKHKDNLDSAYFEALGDKQYRRLDKICKKVINSKSFFNTPEEYNEAMPGPKISRDMTSKLIFASNFEGESTKKGRLKQDNTKVAYGFYVSEDSFNRSGSSRFTDNILATYIHEFDHFVLSALQNPPLNLAYFALTNDVGEAGNSRDLMTVVGEVMESDLSNKEKIEKALLAGSAYSLKDNGELATRILDQNILKSIGIEVDLDWRNKDRQYIGMRLPGTLKAFGIPMKGDPFKRIDDKEVVRRILDWKQYFNPLSSTPFIDNLYSDLGKLKVETVTLDEMLKIAKQGGKRK